MGVRVHCGVHILNLPRLLRSVLHPLCRCASLVIALTTGFRIPSAYPPRLCIFSVAAEGGCASPRCPTGCAGGVGNQVRRWGGRPDAQMGSRRREGACPLERSVIERSVMERSVIWRRRKPV